MHSQTEAVRKYLADLEPGEVRVRVAGGPTVPWPELRSYRRNRLKDQGRDLRKLCRAIAVSGFAFPVFVWAGHEHVLDGAGRVPALVILEELGWSVPPEIPVSWIEAESEAEAAELAMMASSKHGDITEESLLAHTAGLDIDLEIVALKVDLPGINLSGFADLPPRSGKSRARIASSRARNEERVNHRHSPMQTKAVHVRWILGHVEKVLARCRCGLVRYELRQGPKKPGRLLESGPWQKGKR